MSICVMGLKCMICDDRIMRNCQIRKCLFGERFHPRKWGGNCRLKDMWHRSICEFKWSETRAIVYRRINRKFGHGEPVDPVALVVCHSASEDLSDSPDGALPHCIHLGVICCGHQQFHAHQAMEFAPEFRYKLRVSIGYYGLREAMYPNDLLKE